MATGGCKLLTNILAFTYKISFLLIFSIKLIITNFSQVTNMT